MENVQQSTEKSFNYADLAPHPTRTLKLSKVNVADYTHFRLLQAEELSGNQDMVNIKSFPATIGPGTIGTLAKLLVFVYGDLSTIKAIRGTESHMAEELHDTESLNYLYRSTDNAPSHTLKPEFKSAEAKEA